MVMRVLGRPTDEDVSSRMAIKEADNLLSARERRWRSGFTISEPGQAPSVVDKLRGLPPAPDNCHVAYRVPETYSKPPWRATRVWRDLLRTQSRG